jgi:hypothetical protein
LESSYAIAPYLKGCFIIILFYFFGLVNNVHVKFKKFIVLSP